MTRRLLLLTLAALAATPPRAAGAEPAGPPPPSPGAIEVLDRDGAGRPTLARVALGHALPAWVESRMALGGTWSFLLAEPDGVVVLDVGPRYPLAWWVLPWPALKQGARRLPGNHDILEAVAQLFPGKPITQIVLSHWHADHTEDAPALQAEAWERFGRRAPLRIMPQDREVRRRGLMPAGAENVFVGAGFHPGDWWWGPDLHDGEPIGRTGFEVFAMPGHTPGTIALVDRNRRIALGPSTRRVAARGNWWSESRDETAESLRRYAETTYGYRRYSSHPGREAFQAWPADPPAAGRVACD